MKSITTIGLLLTVISLAGCDIPFLPEKDSPEKIEADGKAIGGACRHALRGVEDCYNLNPKASKSAIFNGWKEMDVYMRENKLDGMTPVVPPPKVDPPPLPDNKKKSKKTKDDEEVIEEQSDHSSEKPKNKH